MVSDRDESNLTPMNIDDNAEMANVRMMPSDNENGTENSDRQVFYKVQIKQKSKAIPKMYSFRDKAQSQLVLDGLDMLQASELGMHLYAYYRLHHRVHLLKDESQQFLRKRSLWPNQMPPPIDCTYNRNAGPHKRTVASAKTLLRNGLDSALTKIVTQRLKKDGKRRAVSPSPKVGALVDQFSDILDNILELYPTFNPANRLAEFDAPELILFPRAADRIRNLLSLNNESEPLSHSALPDKRGNEGGDAGITLPEIVKALKTQRELYHIGGDSIGKSVRVVGIGKTPLHVHEFMLDARMFLDEFAGPDGHEETIASGIDLPIITIPQVIPAYFQNIPELKKYFKFRFGMFKHNRNNTEKKEIPEWKRNLERLPFTLEIPKAEPKKVPVVPMECTLPLVMNSAEWKERMDKIQRANAAASTRNSFQRDTKENIVAPWEIDPRMPPPPAFLAKQLGFGAKSESEDDHESTEESSVKQELSAGSAVNKEGELSPTSLKRRRLILNAQKRSYVYVEEAILSPAMYDLMCEFAGELFYQHPAAPRPMPQPNPKVAAALGYTIVDDPPCAPVQCAPMPQPPGLVSAKSLGYNFRMLKEITLHQLENNCYYVSNIPGAEEALSRYKNLSVNPPDKLNKDPSEATSVKPDFVLSDSESDFDSYSESDFDSEG